MSRLALFGTRFTMEADFYHNTFAAAGIEVISPQEDERTFINEKYFGELVQGKIVESTREALVNIAQAMAARDGIDGIILGGTELSLILRDERDTGMPVLDTVRIHAEAIVDRLLGK
jgi:aspartate racemase